MDWRKLKISQLIGLLVAATLCAACVIFLCFARLPQARQMPAPVVQADMAKLHAQWKDAVLQATSKLNADSVPADITQAYDAIVALRVAANDRDADLRIVMALLAMQHGQSGSYAALQQALTQIK